MRKIKNAIRSFSLSSTILLGIAVSIALFVINIGFILFVFHDMQIYSSLINDTGKVRGGSQRLIKNELMQGNTDSQLTELNQVLNRIDDEQKRLSIRFASSADYQKKLEALITQWQSVHTEIKQYRTGSLKGSQLLESSEQLWYVADQAVSSVEQAAHFDISLYYIVSIISSVTVILFFGSVLALRAFIRDRTECDLNHDPLTGLYNRYYLSQLMEQKPLPADGIKNAVYVLVCDIDHFRSINDAYGHEMGDRVIKAVAKRLKQQTHSPDLAIRLSGETFILLIHSSSTPEALKRAQHLKDSIEQLQVQEGLHLTLSIGLSSYNPEILWEDVLKNAHLALYEAKHSGRNSICTHNL